MAAVGKIELPAVGTARFASLFHVQHSLYHVRTYDLQLRNLHINDVCNKIVP